MSHNAPQSVFPEDSFRSKVIQGLSWSTVSTVVTQATNILTFIVLGRFFLEPGDFGLVALIVVLTGFASIFTEFGLGAALIQKQDVQESHKSSLFWLSLLLGLFFYFVFLALRPVIVDFYERPVLYPMVTLSALTLVIGAASSIHMTLLRKELRFKAIALADIAACLLSSVVAIALASFDFGPWAIIGKNIVMSLVLFVAACIACPWHPKWMFCPRAIKEVLEFSLSYLGTKTFSYAAVKCDEFMIGKYVGNSGLGLYSNAFKLVYLPVTLIKNQVVGVFFPTLSSIQDDKERIKVIALQLSGLLAMAGFPALFYVVISSGDWIELLLGEAWSDMEKMMVLLAFIAMLEISIFPGVIFLCQGARRQLLSIDVMGQVIELRWDHHRRPCQRDNGCTVRAVDHSRLEFLALHLFFGTPDQHDSQGTTEGQFSAFYCCKHCCSSKSMGVALDAR